MRKVGGDRVGSVGEAGKAIRVLLHEAHDPPTAARLEAVGDVNQYEPGGGRQR